MGPTVRERLPNTMVTSSPKDGLDKNTQEEAQWNGLAKMSDSFRGFFLWFCQRHKLRHYQKCYEEFKKCLQWAFSLSTLRQFLASPLMDWSSQQISETLTARFLRNQCEERYKTLLRLNSPSTPLQCPPKNSAGCCLRKKLPVSILGLPFLTAKKWSTKLTMITFFQECLWSKDIPRPRSDNQRGSMLTPACLHKANF